MSTSARAVFRAGRSGFREHTRPGISSGLLSVNGAWGESFEGTKGEIGE